MLSFSALLVVAVLLLAALVPSCADEAGGAVTPAPRSQASPAR